jgi:hypothetical protein
MMRCSSRSAAFSASSARWRASTLLITQIEPFASSAGSTRLPVTRIQNDSPLRRLPRTSAW